MSLASSLALTGLLLCAQAGPAAAQVRDGNSGSAESSRASSFTAESPTDNHGTADVVGPDHHEEVHVTITYSVWVGTNVTENYMLTLHPVRNTSFYDVMSLAASIDEHYKFEATEWPYGHYITSLAGYKEDPASYMFWLIYQTPQQPDPASPPGDNLLTPVGVDSLFVDDGDNYLFWLRKL